MFTDIYIKKFIIEDHIHNKKIKTIYTRLILPDVEARLKD